MFWILGIIIFFYILTIAGDAWLEYINYRYLLKHGLEIPAEFKDVLDDELMKKTVDYTVTKTKFGVISSLYNELLAVIFIFGGLLNWYNDRLYYMSLPFVLWGLIFVMVLSYAKTLLDIPFSIYSTFKIEKRFGFNTMTAWTWTTDLIKSLIISTLLFSLLLCGAFWVIEKLPDLWWLPVWALFFVFTLFVVYISPYVIEPLFNKFIPVDDKDLVHRIKETLLKAGIKVKGVYKMDASKRTRHTNAYFSGFGHQKRIVLYDTLLEKLDNDEIIAVLAHEAGHGKKRHVMKSLIIFETLSALAAFGAFVLLRYDFLSKLFSLNHDTLFAKLILLSFIASIIFWFLPPLCNALSRHFERQADDFARDVADADALARALIKLSVDNLSNVHPQKLYAWFHYSHPPVLERIRALRRKY